MKQTFRLIALSSLLLCGCSDDSTGAGPTDQWILDASRTPGAAADAGEADAGEAREDAAVAPSGQAIETIIAQRIPDREGSAMIGRARIIEREDKSVALIAHDYEYVSLLSSGDPSALGRAHVDVHTIAVSIAVGEDVVDVACGGGIDVFRFSLDSFAIDDETIARVEGREGDAVILSAGEVGTTTLTIEGRLSYNRDAVRSDRRLGPDPRCRLMWDGELPMSVRATVEVLASNAREPYAKLTFQKLDGCREEGDAPLAILEGRAASVRYTLSSGPEPFDWHKPANWMGSDAMILRSSVGGPAFAVSDNSEELVSLCHTSGTGLATIVSPRGPTQAIEGRDLSRRRAGRDRLLRR